MITEFRGLVRTFHVPCSQPCTRSYPSTRQVLIGIDRHLTTYRSNVINNSKPYRGTEILSKLRATIPTHTRLMTETHFLRYPSPPYLSSWHETMQYCKDEAIYALLGDNLD